MPILITAALPYANGDIHLGHLLEYIQADIFSRHKKYIKGNQVYYICADDTHGSAVMLEAQKQGLTPEELIERIHITHEADLRHFDIDFDIYYTTHSPENREISTEIFTKLKENGAIFEREVEQLFDEEKQLFLADRFVKGTCPKCKSADQYGDNCDKCGSTYSATELLNPISVYSKTTPILKKSKHYFLDLEKNRGFLENFLKNTLEIQSELRNKVLEWFDAPLRAWDISRDAPYFGFKIPGEENKYFYVWLDAPIGYMASFKKLCEQKNIPFSWNESTIYQFIGKDIAYFHCLFWVNMLCLSGYQLPKGIFAHGFVNVGGEKMSKSRGNFLKAEDLKHIDTNFIRYYLASKLNDRIEDVDFAPNNFIDTINSELIGKLINIASRTAKILEKTNANVLSNVDMSALSEFVEAEKDIFSLYEAREFSKICRLISSLADTSNKYVNDHEPWKLAKADEVAATKICSTAINMYHLLITYLAPILPKLYESSAKFLSREPTFYWGEIKILDNHKINSFTPLATRIDNTIFEGKL